MSSQKSTTSKIAFIGGGQMAIALIAGLLKSGRASNSIVVLEPSAEQRARLVELLGVVVVGEACEELSASTVVWAVKPQVLEAAVMTVLPYLSGALHLSIVAGISSLTLSQWLESEKVVRVMPNTPAMIGAGVTGMFAMPTVSEKDKETVSEIFGPTGYCFWVNSDAEIDAVTAVSGSGPGYVFEFLSCLQKAAQSVGFSESVARELAVRTALGAAMQAATDETELETLRNRVTSKRGTTEAGLSVFAEHALEETVCHAVNKARERASELSRELSGEKLD